MVQFFHVDFGTYSHWFLSDYLQKGTQYDNKSQNGR